ncbi:hypothetical protein [uncultured Mitsuokella sp.]|nr:hypothetical protein [uncultured Mitsuokella sp.]
MESVKKKWNWRPLLALLTAVSFVVFAAGCGQQQEPAKQAQTESSAAA